jgi:hypothetical protein
LGLHSIVIWSDTPFTISMLWLLYALARVFDEVLYEGKAPSRSLCVQLCISLVFVCFFRSNSFPIYLVMAPVLAILFYKKKKWGLLITVGVSAIAAFLVYVPLYGALGVITDSAANNVRYYALLNDVKGTYHRGGDFSGRSLEILRRTVPGIDAQEVRDEYDPALAVSAHFVLDGLELDEFAYLYFDSLMRNPIKMAAVTVQRLEAYWVIPARRTMHLVNYTTIYDRVNNAHGSAPTIGVFRQHNILTDAMNSLLSLTSDPLSRTFIWWFGLWVALKVIFALFFILNRRYIFLLLFLPELVYLGTLFIGCVWLDYRYGLPLFVNGLFMPMLTALCMNKRRKSVAA